MRRWIVTALLCMAVATAASPAAALGLGQLAVIVDSDVPATV